MNMAQIVAVGLIGTILLHNNKRTKTRNKPFDSSYNIGVLIFISVCTKLEILISLLEETAQKAGKMSERDILPLC